MTTLSFDDFVEFIRGHWPIRPKDGIIRPETQFERDLDLAGDDGDDLLEAVQEHYQIQFIAETFNLKPNEKLFHDEASPWVGPHIQTLFGPSTRSVAQVRPFAIGDLYQALQKEFARKAEPSL